MHAYFCDVCAGFHLTKHAMPNIDLKSFLRSKGFRHLRDADRGATWGNGVVDLFIEKSYDKEPAKLRAIMDQIREAERKKIRLQRAEDEKLKAHTAKIQTSPAPAPPPAWKAPETPEEHRKAQIESVKETIVATPQPKPEKPVSITGKKYKKLPPDEAQYVFGRMKAMFQAKMDNAAVAKALQAEGVKQANGKPFDATAVSMTRWGWQKVPSRADRYAAILMPRRSNGAPTPPAPPRPVVVAEAPKVPRTRFNLPLTVDAVIHDPEVSPDERLQVYLTFVEMPDSATRVLADESLSIEQKLLVVEAIGRRREGKKDVVQSPAK